MLPTGKTGHHFCLQNLSLGFLKLPKGGYNRFSYIVTSYLVQLCFFLYQDKGPSSNMVSDLGILLKGEKKQSYS